MKQKQQRQQQQKTTEYSQNWRPTRDNLLLSQNRWIVCTTFQLTLSRSIFFFRSFVRFKSKLKLCTQVKISVSYSIFGCQENVINFVSDYGSFYVREWINEWVSASSASVSKNSFEIERIFANGFFRTSIQSNCICTLENQLNRFLFLQNLLQCEPTARRSNERTISRNDWTIATRDTSVVPE